MSDNRQKALAASYTFLTSPALLWIQSNTFIDPKESGQPNLNYKPIPGLYAAGLAGGDTSGAADWQMGSGVANGHCMTAGRYTVLHALNGKLEATHPVSWEEVSGDYDMTVLDSTWQQLGARSVTQ